MLPRRTLNEMSSTARTVRSPTVKVLDSERTSIWLAPLFARLRLALRLASAARYRSGLTAGTSACSSRAYSDVGAANTCAAGPRSCTTPSFSTTSESARSAATARSWVMNSTPMPERLLELGEQVEDALLDRHVEARGRLVGHDQRGPGQHRQADQHPLEHAARQLVRVGLADPLGVGQADLAEGLEHALAAGGGVAVRQQRGRLQRLRPDRPDRVQRVARVLRDEAELAPAQRPELALPQLEHVLAVELDLPGQ